MDKFSHVGIERETYFFLGHNTLHAGVHPRSIAVDASVSRPTIRNTTGFKESVRIVRYIDHQINSQVLVLPESLFTVVRRCSLLFTVVRYRIERWNPRTDSNRRRELRRLSTGSAGRGIYTGAGSGSRTRMGFLGKEACYHNRTRIQMVYAAGFEPAIFGLSGRRLCLT